MIHPLHIYICASEDNQLEIENNLAICTELEKNQHKVFLPQREFALKKGQEKPKFDPLAKQNKRLALLRAIRDSKLVVAVLYGYDDPNVYYQIGYAHASKIPVIAVNSGSRKEGVMTSVLPICKNKEDLVKYINKTQCCTGSAGYEAALRYVYRW